MSDSPDTSGTWGTSSTLLGRIKANDRGAWESFCDIYTPLVYGWARKYRLQEADAEDITQEVFRRVASGLGRFRYDNETRSFRGWLWTITRHAICDFFSKQGGQLAVAQGGSHATRLLADAPDGLDDDNPDGPQLDASEESALIRRALTLVEADFSLQTWTAFWRFAIEGHQASDVAADLEMSSTAVRQAKFRVMARLREVLG